MYPKYPEESAISCLYYKAKKFRTLRNWPGVISTCKYFKFGLNTSGLSQSHFRNLSACSITKVMAVCINTFTSICHFQSYSKLDLSRTDFVINTVYLHGNSGLFL